MIRAIYNLLGSLSLFNNNYLMQCDSVNLRAEVLMLTIVLTRCLSVTWPSGIIILLIMLPLMIAKHIMITVIRLFSGHDNQINRHKRN